MMNARNRTTLAAAVLAGLAMLGAGCSDQKSSQTAGQKLDRATEKVAAATEQAAAKTAVVVDDTAITTAVKAAVLAEPGLKTLQIEVDTKNAVVTLTGNVDNMALKDRASQIAQNVSGVKSVDNNLVVKSTG